MSSDEDRGKKSAMNTNIMFAAILSLFAIVFLILFLHLYARYLIRCRERRRRATLYRLSNQIAPEVPNSSETPNPGLDPLVISSLPSFTYKLTNRLGHGETVECSVCLGTVAGDDLVRVLPNCKHIFHVDCIDAWLGLHTTCPLCRTEAQPDEIYLGNGAQPLSPPMEGNMLHGGEQLEEEGGSGSRLGSFRRMLSRGRLPRTRSCGDEIAAEDPERQ